MDPNAGGAYPPPAAQRKTSPWLYVGCGCAVLIVLLIVAGYFVSRKVVEAGRNIAQGMKDPRVAEQRTRELLAYTSLPDGYYPAGAISIPFLMDMAFLDDHPFEPGEDHGRLNFDKHGFMYIRMRHANLPEDEASQERILNRTNSNGSWQQGSGLTIQSEEPLTQGDLTAGGTKVRYRATRGRVQMNNHSHEGITAFLLPICPDHHLRIGIWFGSDPAPDQSAATLDKTGTPADPHAIVTFLDHFNLCAGGS